MFVVSAAHARTIDSADYLPAGGHRSQRVGDPEHQPPSDTERDADDPWVDSQIDAYPDQPAPNRAAIDLGEASYASGEPTVVRSSDGETAIRACAVEIDHADESRRASLTAATSEERMLRALLEGEDVRRSADSLPWRNRAFAASASTLASTSA
jgi:hypothetical protein